MSAVQITVRGAFVAHRQPERGTVTVDVALQSPSPTQVYAAVAESGQAVLASITPLHSPDSGPVTWFSSGRVRTWAQRPWNQDGKQLPLVHHASQSITAKFSDFEELSKWLTAAVGITGVTVTNTEWTLTEKVRMELTRQVRAKAVQNARDKAQEYADALELGPVRVIEIADSGMLGEGLQPETGQVVAYARGMAADAGGGVQLVPEDVSVEASVDARFLIG